MNTNIEEGIQEFVSYYFINFMEPLNLSSSSQEISL